MTKPESREAPVKNARSWRRAAWGAFAAIIALGALLNQWQVLSFPHLEKPLGPADPDDWLYLTQVRQWLQGGISGFFDNTVLNTNAPAGGVHIHWTRPMQMLLALFYFLTPSARGTDVRLMLAANWLAPCLCIVAVLLMAKTARRHLDQAHVVICAILLTIFNTYRQNYFMPGNSDHHGFLSVLWCGVLCILTATAPSLGLSLLAGALLGLMTWISVEGIVLVGIVYALLGLEALFKPEKMRSLTFISAGAAVVAAWGLLVEKPAGEFFLNPAFDTLSIVHVFLLFTAAAGMAALSRLYATGMGLRGRLISAALAGGTVLFGMILLFPKFFKGPLVDADPYIMTDFMPYVTEAMPLFKAPWDDILQEVAQPLLAAVLLVFCLRHRLRAEKRRMLMLWGALLACTAVLTVIEARWEYYLQPIAIVVCAALLPELSMLAPRLFPARLRSKLGIPRQWRPDLAVFLLAMIVNFAVNLPRALPLLTGGGNQTAEKSAVSAAKESTSPESCTGEIRYVLQTGQLPALLGKDNLVLFVTPDAGGDVLFFTRYRIIASNYHREGPGLHDMMRIATAKSPEAARPLLRARQIGAMLFCNAEEKKALWPYTVAKTGKHPRWLVPVQGLHFSSAKGDKPLLFKVEQ